MSAPDRIAKIPLHCLAYRLVGTISQRTWIEQQFLLAMTSLLAKGASMTTLDAREKTPLDLANDFQNEWFNSTLYIFGTEGLEIFALGGVYLNGKGFLTPSRLNKSPSLPKANGQEEIGEAGGPKNVQSRVQEGL